MAEAAVEEASESFRSRKNHRRRVLTNNFELPRGGKEIWYSLFVGGDQSLRVIEAHSQSLTYRANLSRALAGPLRALDHVAVAQKPHTTDFAGRNLGSLSHVILPDCPRIRAHNSPQSAQKFTTLEWSSSQAACFARGAYVSPHLASARVA